MCEWRCGYECACAQPMFGSQKANFDIGPPTYSTFSL